jgi:hypothetical protein
LEDHSMSDTAEPIAARTSARTEEPIAAARIVTFATQWGSYYAGESAAFNEIDAAALVELGVATEGETAGEPTRQPPPDVPRGGVMVAGLEFPPRRLPPDPQHLDIPQTYDPIVRHQLERAARDRAAGKPGTAAQEDLDREMDRLKEAHPQAHPRTPPPPTDRA